MNRNNGTCRNGLVKLTRRTDGYLASNSRNCNARAILSNASPLVSNTSIDPERYGRWISPGLRKCENLDKDLRHLARSPESAKELEIHSLRFPSTWGLVFSRVLQPQIHSPVDSAWVRDRHRGCRSCHPALRGIVLRNRSMLLSKREPQEPQELPMRLIQTLVPPVIVELS